MKFLQNDEVRVRAIETLRVIESKAEGMNDWFAIGSVTYGRVVRGGGFIQQEENAAIASPTHPETERCPHLLPFYVVSYPLEFNPNRAAAGHKIVSFLREALVTVFNN